MAEAAQSHTESHGSVGHTVPLSLLTGVFLALLFLTWVTVAIAQVDLGELNLLVALAVATVKASLVLLYFMHLRWDNPLNAFIFIFSLVCVALFIFFAMIDTHAYDPDLIPGHAPLINQQ